MAIKAFVTLLILLNSITSNSARLSEQSVVSILTCSPGDELYSTFGHTALRVADPTKGIDLVFNFGTFDFNTPNFYLKFSRGQLDYMLSIVPFENFLHEYRYQGRSVVEQVIDFSHDEKQQIFEALLHNAKPENRYYLYHFFFDNCATRVRDIVISHLTDSVSLIREPAFSGELTFRDALEPYTEDTPWIKLGLNLVLGQPSDGYVDGWTAQFLPDHLMWQFAQARFHNSGNPIVKQTNTILEFNQKDIDTRPGPVFWLWVITLPLFWLTWQEIRGKFNRHWVNSILFSITSLIGLLITFLWFFTSHQVTGPNWHLLWANPLHLVFVFGHCKRWANVTRFVRYGLTFMIMITIAMFAILPQYMPVSLLPVWLLLLARSVNLSFRGK